MEDLIGKILFAIGSLLTLVAIVLWISCAIDVYKENSMLGQGYHKSCNLTEPYDCKWVK